MLVQIERWFGYKLPHSVLVEHPDDSRVGCLPPSELCREMAGAGNARRRGANLPPLFIAHGIGGSLLSFVELAAQLGPEQPVYGLQLPASIDEHQARFEDTWRQIMCARCARFSHPAPTTLPGILPVA